MQIVSINFAILAFASIIIFYLLDHKFRIGYLAILSCGFIASFQYYLLIYILCYSLINYSLGIKIPNSKFKLALFRTGIIFNLSQLIILNYASFAIDPALHIFNSNLHFSRLSEIVIPVGISYFTLQGIGYLINVKMGWEKPEKRFQNLLLYFTFYPKFISGPIERSNHFLPQLKSIRPFNEKQVTDGLRIALIGLFKKIVIANQLGIYVAGAYTDLSSYGGYALITVIVIQPLYLYFDFSGYTDIAIGLGKTFGIDLLPNFNRPFLAENVTTFWKRFHMSLSLWFNDYVFKQVSFRFRKLGKYASVLAVFITFTLFGIWHGAGWNFMILGFLQALAINYEFFTKRVRIRIFSKIPDYLRIWIGRITTYIFYGLSLVFFFSPDMNSVFSFFSELKYFGKTTQINMLKEAYFLALVLSICFLLAEIFNNDFQHYINKCKKSLSFYPNWLKVLRWVIYLIIITAIILFNNKVQQFIYFQF